MMERSGNNRGAYDNGRNDASRGNVPRSNHGGGNYDTRPRQEASKEIEPLKLPEDYVDQAESVIRKFDRIDEKTNKPAKTISTSKLRNLLSLASEIYNVENKSTASRIKAQSLARINQMRIRVAYECGREAETKSFVVEAKILNYLKYLSQEHDGSREETIRFAHYMEALVAYHRYYDLKGKED